MRTGPTGARKSSAGFTVKMVVALVVLPKLFVTVTLKEAPFAPVVDAGGSVKRSASAGPVLARPVG